MANLCSECGCPKPRKIGAELLVREDATFWRGERVPFTRTEQRLFNALSRTGFLSHDQIETLLPSWEGWTNLGSVHICHLRRKLAAVSGPKITCERGEGFRLEPMTNKGMS